MDIPNPDPAGSSSGSQQPGDPPRLGTEGEALAARYLERLGYRILARNWRSPHTRNEIDLIAQDGDCIVFVEVKTSQTGTYGSPLEWITPRKREAIVVAARAFLAGFPARNLSFRFDAVGLTRSDSSESWSIEHVRDAFRPGA